MALTKLGLYIEQLDLRNEKDEYGEDSVVGLSTQKQIIKTKADLSGVKLTSYKLFMPKTFAYVPDTSRRGDKMSMAYNMSDETYLVSSISIIFKVTKTEKLLPDYLFMYFNRPEFDRYSRFNSWGSARETFSWEDMCDIEISLPPISVQQKYVDIYNAMLENQRCYERGLEDLKLVCDAYIDKLKKICPLISIGNYINQTDNRNTNNSYSLFKGLSMNNYFIDSIANDVGLDLSKYKIVKSGELACVLMKVGRDCRLTVAKNDSSECFIISPAYYTFKLKNIVPDYFMVCVSRFEFERRAWFSCDSSARGSLSWGEFCDLQIPDASFEQQTIISNLYEAYMIRSNINERLKEKIKKLCPVLIKGAIEEGECS